MKLCCRKEQYTPLVVIFVNKKNDTIIDNKVFGDPVDNGGASEEKNEGLAEVKPKRSTGPKLMSVKFVAGPS